MMTIILPAEADDTVMIVDQAAVGDRYAALNTTNMPIAPSSIIFTMASKNIGDFKDGAHGVHLSRAE